MVWLVVDEDSARVVVAPDLGGFEPPRFLVWDAITGRQKNPPKVRKKSTRNREKEEANERRKVNDLRRKIPSDVSWKNIFCRVWRRREVQSSPESKLLWLLLRKTGVQKQEREKTARQCVWNTRKALITAGESTSQSTFHRPAKASGK